MDFDQQKHHLRKTSAVWTQILVLEAQMFCPRIVWMKVRGLYIMDIWFVVAMHVRMQQDFGMRFGKFGSLVGMVAILKYSLDT